MGSNSPFISILWHSMIIMLFLLQAFIMGELVPNTIRLYTIMLARSHDVRSAWDKFETAQIQERYMTRTVQHLFQSGDHQCNGCDIYGTNAQSGNVPSRKKFTEITAKMLLTMLLPDYMPVLKFMTSSVCLLNWHILMLQMDNFDVSWFWVTEIITHLF